MKRILRNLVILCIALILVLVVGCSNRNTPAANNSQAQQTQVEQSNDGNDQTGYIFSSGKSAVFVQWIEVDKQLTGQFQTFTITDSLKSKSDNHPFKGIHSGKDISINFSGSVWTDDYSGNNWTGTLKGKELTLVIPAQDGTLKTVVFNKGSVADYNQRVIELQDTASAEQANRDTQNAEAKKAEEQNNSILSARKQVAYKISDLTSSINNLKDNSSFEDVMQNYEDAWTQMQDNYKNMTDAANDKPLDDYKIGNIEYQLGTVEYALGSVEYVNGTLDYKKKSITDYIDEVNKGVTALQTAFETLKTTDSAYASTCEGAVNQTIKEAQEQIAVSNNVIKQAESQASSYISKAKKLLNQGKAFVDALKVE